MASRAFTTEYLTTTRMGEKGQVTVPKAFREDLGLKTGAPVAVLRVGDGLVLLPEQERLEQLCDRISAAFAGQKIPPGTILSTLPQARELVFQRHYGKGSRKAHSRQRKTSPDA